MQKLRSRHIIHIFAIVHAVIVLLCYASGVRDEFFLTVATIALITILAVRRNQGLGIVAACIIAGNILGFVIGTYGARLLSPLISSQAWVHAITSFCATEILGFGLLLLFSRFGSNRHHNTSLAQWLPGLKQIIPLIGLLFLFRIAYSRIFNNLLNEDVANITFRLLLGNSFASLVLVCSNIIYVILTRRLQWFSKPLGYTIGIVTESIAISILTALIIGYNLPFGTSTPFADASFLQLCSISLLANLAVYVVVVLLDYVQTTRYRIIREKEKRHLAQFQYNILKQKVNPHFLFNSLNILNGLVEEQKNTEASEYIHKLASLYRYMLQTEKEHTVCLQEELEFTDRYIDLLKVRFPNGFSVTKKIDIDTATYSVVPCSLQLLIENALKHNVVHPERPLHITISTHNDTISVTNNRQPKYSNAESTHVGLKSISQQYINISGRDIVINENDEQYCVELPLI